MKRIEYTQENDWIENSVENGWIPDAKRQQRDLTKKKEKKKGCCVTLKIDICYLKESILINDFFEIHFHKKTKWNIEYGASIPHSHLKISPSFPSSSSWFFLSMSISSVLSNLHSLSSRRISGKLFPFISSSTPEKSLLESFSLLSSMSIPFECLFC